MRQKHPVFYTKSWHILDKGQDRRTREMDRMKNSDEIKERHEGEAVRNWIKRRREGISMERSREYMKKNEGERNGQK